MDFAKLYQNRFVQLLIIAFIAAIFIAPPAALLQDDLDSAVRWASANLFSLGSDNFYLYPHTNGPLFFLKFPTPERNFIVISVLFDWATNFLLGYYIMLLSKHYRPKNDWLPLVVFMFFCALLPFDFILIGVVLLACLFYLKTVVLKNILPAILVLVIALFIKASISFPVLIIFGTTLLVLLFEKKYLPSLQLIGIAMLIFCSFLFLFYGFNFEGIIFMAQSFLRTLSYGTDQEVYFNNFLPYLLLTIFFCLLPIFFLRNKSNKHFFFLTILVLFSFWKYALGRQDFVHFEAWFHICILLGGTIVIVNAKREAMIGATCYFFSACFFMANTKRTEWAKSYTINTPRVDILPRILMATTTHVTDFKNISQHQLRGRVLSDSILANIGTHTVDVFPWGLAILYKYNLNYKPRPNFHSTILGSRTDEKESDYFASKEAPEYLLWHNSQPALYNLNAHDQVYLPNAVPHTFKSLIQNYQLQQHEKGYALWKKSTRRKLMAAGEVKLKVKMNEWFDVPQVDSNVISFAKTNLQLSAMEKAIKFLYKGPFFKMAYKLENGQEVWHFVSLTSLQSEFLAQPYFINPAMESKRVSKIFIAPMDKKYEHHELEISFFKEIVESAN